MRKLRTKLCWVIADLMPLLCLCAPTTWAHSGATLSGPITMSGVGKLNGVCVLDGQLNTTLTAAVTCAGSNGVIDIPMFSAPTLTANVMIPPGVTLHFWGRGAGSYLTLGNFNLTVNGSLEAPSGQQIFNLSGTGIVTLGASQNYDVTWWGATCGSTDSGTAIQKTIEAANVRGGTVYIPCAVTVTSSLTLNNNTSGFTIQGACPNPSKGCLSQIRFSGNPTALMTFQNSKNVHIRDLTILYTNASFSGHVIDFAGPSASSPSAFDSVESVSITGSRAAVSASCGVYLDKVIDSKITDSSFRAMQTPICGASSSASFSNVIEIARNEFITGTDFPSITNPGNGWKVYMNAFELAGMTNSNVIDGSGAELCGGCSFDANWFGDFNSSWTGAMFFKLGSGVGIRDNLISNASSTSGKLLVLNNNQSGYIITGNSIGTSAQQEKFTTLYTFGTGNNNIVIDANFYNTTGTFMSGSIASGSLTNPAAGSISGFNTNGTIGNWSETNTRMTVLTVAVGSGMAGSTGTITFPITAAHGWNCSAINQSRADFIAQTAQTTTSVTMTNFGTTFAATNFTNGNTLLFQCSAY